MSCVTGAGVAGGLLVRGVMGLRHNGAAGTQGSVRELAGTRPALVRAAVPVPRLVVRCPRPTRRGERFGLPLDTRERACGLPVVDPFAAVPGDVRPWPFATLAPRAV